MHSCSVLPLVREVTVTNMSEAHVPGYPLALNVRGFMMMFSREVSSLVYMSLHIQLSHLALPDSEKDPKSADVGFVT